MHPFAAHAAHPPHVAVHTRASVAWHPCTALLTHNGLQRTEAYAVLEPVLTLCGDLDAVLTEWREVSP